MRFYGPEPKEFFRNPKAPSSRSALHNSIVDFHGCWTDTLGASKWLTPKPERIGDDGGYWRMIPGIVYGVDPNQPKSIVPTYKVTAYGRFYRLKEKTPEINPGWTLVGSSKSKIPLKVDFPNAGVAGGGVHFRIRQPSGWKLQEIGLSDGVEYVASFTPCWESPYSRWIGPKPVTDTEAKRRKIWGDYGLEPIVLAEITNAEIRNEATGQVKTTTTPTGWVVCAGVFRKWNP